jgi:predicted component of type VI protein secretion system
VEGLPVHQPRGPEANQTGPTDRPVTEREERALSEAGFLPLTAIPRSGHAAFLSSLPLLESDSLRGGGLPTADFRWTLAGARFVHFLRVILRDKVGSLQSLDDLVRDLRHWVMQYVSADTEPALQAQAAKPLADARIESIDRSSDRALVVELRPRFQLGELERAAPFQAVLDLPSIFGNATDVWNDPGPQSQQSSWQQPL